MPWMEYVQSKVNPKAIENTSIMEGAQCGAPMGIDSQLGKNLYEDVQDINSSPSYQESYPVNKNDELRKDEGSRLFPAEYNWHNSEEDPAWSFYQKVQDNQSDATGNFLGSNLYGTNEGSGIVVGSLKLAASGLNLQTIIKKSTHAKTSLIRESGAKLRVENSSNKESQSKGLYTFTVAGDGTSNQVTIQFLKDETAKSLADHSCLVACSCPYFLYAGPQYYAVKGKYMYMPLFRPQLIEPRETKDGGRGKGLTFCKHLYAVASQIGHLLEDDKYLEGVQDKLLSIKDPDFAEVGTLDSSAVSEEYHLERKTKFVQFIENAEMHKEVYESAHNQIKQKGLDEHMVLDYVQGVFSELDKKSQADIIKALSENPDLVILLLLEYHTLFHVVPAYLTDVAYKSIKKHILG